VIAVYNLRLCLIFSASLDPNEKSVQLFPFLKGEEESYIAARYNFDGNNSVCYDKRRCHDSEFKQ